MLVRCLPVILPQPGGVLRQRPDLPHVGDMRKTTSKSGNDGQKTPQGGPLQTQGPCVP